MRKRSEICKAVVYLFEDGQEKQIMRDVILLEPLEQAALKKLVVNRHTVMDQRLARHVSYVRNEQADRLWVVPNRDLTSIELVEAAVGLQSHSSSWRIYGFFEADTEQICRYLATAAGFSDQPELLEFLPRKNSRPRRTNCSPAYSCTSSSWYHS